MKILNGEVENNGILLSDEMHLFPFDKLNNHVKATDNMTVDMNFQERFPESTVSTKELEERAKKLSEEIRAAEELLSNANELQYSDADRKALQEKIDAAKVCYEEYDSITSVTPTEKLEALNEKMRAALQALSEAIELFKNSAAVETPTPEDEGKDTKPTVTPTPTAQPTPTAKPTSTAKPTPQTSSQGTNPETGDQNGMQGNLALISFLLSAGVIVGMWVRKKRLQNQK